MRVLLAIFSLITLTAFGQNPNNESIQNCLGNGFDTVENIREKKVSKLDSIFDPATLKRLMELIEQDGDRTYKDLYYDYRTNSYVFTVYEGQEMEDGTDWGLFLYDFILTLFYQSKNGEITLVKTETIFDDKKEKKAWWQSFMLSYDDTKFLRKQWADEYGLVPPPPPAPETSDWLEKK